MDFQQIFADRDHVANYAEGTPRRVPGYADLHRMTQLLLAEYAPAEAEILVVGAGGGLEIAAFAQARPRWRFTGVDPSAEMIALADEVLADVRDRVDLVHGFVDDAPPGPFDGATCLLTLHFLERAERVRTLTEVAGRLKPGAPFVAAHHCRPDGADQQRWLARSIAFAQEGPVDFEQASQSAEMMAGQLPLLSAAEEEAVFREAGLRDVALFYAGFSFRGWVGYAPGG